MIGAGREPERRRGGIARAVPLGRVPVMRAPGARAALQANKTISCRIHKSQQICADRRFSQT